jgi:hypothetical protein
MSDIQVEHNKNATGSRTPDDTDPEIRWYESGWMVI